MNIFQNVLALVKSEESQKALPVLANALTSISNNPTAANVVAQGAASLSAIIEAEISIGQDALKKLAADVSAVAASQVQTPPVVQPVPAPAPAPAPVSTP